MLAVLAVAAAAIQPAKLDPACAHTTRSLVMRYVDAYNKGDVRTLDGLFAPAGLFQRYSSAAPGRRLDAAARDRTTLRAYFAARHRAGDRFRLRAFQLNSANRSRGNYEFTVKRRAPGYRGGSWFTVKGKGAVRCDKRKIVVTTLG
jgi:hypothetical protein